MFFILGVAHVDSFVVQIGSEKAVFRGFTNFFSEVATGLQQKLLILIEPPNIFYRKSAKKWWESTKKASVV